MIRTISFLILAASLSATTLFAKTLRLSGLSSTEILTFLEGHSDNTLEFKQGDIINLKLDVSGEILQAIATPETKVSVKKSFFLRMQEDELLMSWDGETFKPFKELITGSMSASATGEGSITAVVFKLKADAVK